MQVAWHAGKLALDLFLLDNSFYLVDRCRARVPCGLRVIIAKVAYQFMQSDIGDKCEVSGCVASVD